LEEKFKEILNLHIPSYVLPVKPGREVALLIETTVLNHRLKEMGYHSAKEFNIKLLETIAKRQRKGRLNVG
ncbi:MAG: HPr kinase/phosphorylase, partial [Simkania sp.]|nr:HPr kinase/phosphorylase [Simkania sp.]